jgi:hypothetical protein
VRFRASPELQGRLEAVAQGLELSTAELVRMILTEHLDHYERRVAEAAAWRGAIRRIGHRDYP